MTVSAPNSAQLAVDSSLVWEREARRILKALIVRDGCSAKELSRRLQKSGLTIEPKALANRINRGTFGFAFFLAVANVLEVDRVDVRCPRARSSLGTP